MPENKMLRTLFLGFVRIHILHHCAKRPWFGQELMEELSEHGYKFSFGTLYPLLHGMENEGWLSVTSEKLSGHWRKYYTCTKKGRAVLEMAKKRAEELSNELEETHD